MAMTTCNECSKEVSTKAKKCPHCGAKVDKPIGVIGICMVVFVGWIFYSAFSSNPPSSSVSSKQSIDPTVASTEKPVKPEAAWQTSVSIDEMTGNTKAFASSKSVSPTRQMTFPYSNVKGWVGVGCDGISEWAYFGFSTAPNISKDETKSGYSIISTRIKWDDLIQNTRLNQEWGAKFIHFDNQSEAISKITSSSKLMLELNWHGEGMVNFDFSLNGSSAALHEMREKCK